MSVCVDSTRTRDALADEGGLYGAAQALRSAVHKSMCSLPGRGMSCMTKDYRGDPAPWKLNLQSIQMARRFVAPLLAPLKQRLSLYLNEATFSASPVFGPDIEASQPLTSGST